MASLGLVSPGAVTDGVTLFFLDEIFSHLLLESDDILYLAVSSPLPSSHVVYPVFFLNSATKIILFGCHPLDGVTRGGPPPSPVVTPLVDGRVLYWPLRVWLSVPVQSMPGKGRL